MKAGREEHDTEMDAFMNVRLDFTTFLLKQEEFRLSFVCRFW